MTVDGQTAIEKIMSRASGSARVPPGDVVVCAIDMTVLIDFQFRAFNQWSRPLRISDPAKVAVILDHGAPAPSIGDANAHAEARAFVAEFGIPNFFDIGHHGICHQVVAEQGLARPGGMLVCADSHTCSGGAFNCAARGLGPMEVLQVLCTGQTWFVVPETVRVELTGRLPVGVTAKDAFLHLAGRYAHATANRAIEFDGPALAGLDMHDRRVLATHGIELLAEFALFPCDDVTTAALAVADGPVDPLWSDAEAPVADRIQVALDDVEPFVGLPGGVVDNSVPLADVGEVTVQQC